MEMQPPVMGDGEGEEMTDDESLSILSYRHSSRDGIPDIEGRIAAIEDPLIRQVCDLMLDGLTQEAIAKKLGLSLGALKLRLFRFRERKTDSLLMAA